MPAASVATAVTTSAPWPAGVTDVVQCPVPSTVTAAPLTVSEEPISAVPLIWIPPAASAALMMLSPPSMVVIATAGAMVSTVSVVEVLAELPAASVATAVTASAPWPAGVTDVVQCPVPSTVTAAPLTVSVEPISAVPLIWIPPAASAALMILSPPSMVVIATAGAVVSSVKLSEAVPVLPKPSVWLATMVCGPSASPAGVNDHVPWASAVTVVGNRAAIDREVHHGVGQPGPGQRLVRGDPVARRCPAIDRQALGHGRTGGAQRIDHCAAAAGVAGGIGVARGQRVAAIGQRDAGGPEAVLVDRYRGQLQLAAVVEQR